MIIISMHIQFCEGANNPLQGFVEQSSQNEQNSQTSIDDSFSTGKNNNYICIYGFKWLAKIVGFKYLQLHLLVIAAELWLSYCHIIVYDTSTI